MTESRSPQFKSGDEVIVTGYDLGMNTSGGFAEFIRVPSGWIVPRPSPLSLKESMIYGTAGFTAALSIFELIDHGLETQQGPVLVTGATGGVGSLAVSILSKIGFRVAAVSGKADRKAFLEDLGATEVISREEADRHIRSAPAERPLGGSCRHGGGRHFGHGHQSDPVRRVHCLLRTGRFSRIEYNRLSVYLTQGQPAGHRFGGLSDGSSFEDLAKTRRRLETGTPR